MNIYVKCDDQSILYFILQKAIFLCSFFLFQPNAVLHAYYMNYIMQAA